ncbi:hypothetical protein P3X83_01515 (plasmid) [Spongiactinospora sp. TRM90649]|nr:hypothetical protein [Spongiactinospora sp. TRM90649]
MDDGQDGGKKGQEGVGLKASTTSSWKAHRNMSANRAFSIRLRELREAPPYWSRADLARRLRAAAHPDDPIPHVPSLIGLIKQWEAGRHTPGRRYRPLLARALRVPEHELFGDASPTTGPEDGATRLSLTSLNGSPASRKLAREHGDVWVIREMLRSLTASDRQFGGEHVREYATGYLSDVITPRLHRCAKSKERRELAAVSVEFSLRVAAMHLDAGHDTMSHHLLGVALGLAQQINDRPLAAWVLSRWGEQALHEASLLPDRHRQLIDSAVACTTAAAAMVKDAPPMARSFILTKVALATSLTGDRTSTKRALGQVWTAYGQVGTLEEPAWVDAYEWGHLRHEEARCYANLGMAAEATQAAEDALRVRTEARPRAFSLGVAALGYAQAPGADIERACALGQDLIDAAAELRSRRLMLRVSEVLQALAPHRGRRDVEALRESATTVLGRGTG